MMNDDHEPISRPVVDGDIRLSGLANDIYKYLVETAKRQRPELYPFAVLHILAMVGKHRENVLGVKTNLMTLGIAPTAAGKEHPQQVTRTLLIEQKYGHFLFGDIGSHKDIIVNLLESDGTCLYIVDEVHSLFKSMKSHKAESYETKMEKEILSAYTSNHYLFRGIDKRDNDKYLKLHEDATSNRDAAQTESDEYKRFEALANKYKRQSDYLINGLPNPRISLMGHSTPDNLDNFVSKANIASGLLGRMLIVRCGDNVNPLYEANLTKSQLTDKQKSISEKLQQIKASNEIINITVDARKYLNDCIAWYDDEPQRNHSELSGVYCRAPEHLKKIACILGASSGEITIQDVKAAFWIVENSITAVRFLLLQREASETNAKANDVWQYAITNVLRNCKGQGQTESKVREKIGASKGIKELSKHRDYQGIDLIQCIFDQLIEKQLLKRVIKGKRERYITVEK